MVMDAKTVTAVGELVQAAAHKYGLTGPIEFHVLSRDVSQGVTKMNANEYQELAGRTMVRDRDEIELNHFQKRLLWAAIGVSGEAGEVAELAKKQIFHKQGLDTQKWIKELGDVLWYVANCCDVLDLKMEDVMTANIEKLKARFPDGWDHERSTFREGSAA